MSFVQMVIQQILTVDKNASLLQGFFKEKYR